ncbi:MAG TPA: Clp protease N-terminal domain-containing protein [Mycobacteriales bacterium]|nr:Clp protease N-terminal domain-containing protein [Mycobacteriales bacterium]
MFERFTDGSRRAVVLAQQSAVDLHHPAIAAEHLFLGVARAELGSAAVVLAEQGATPDRLEAALRQVAPPVPAAPRGGDRHVPFTPAAKQALELSLRESMKRGADAIDTGHILLALLRQPGDQLPAVLRIAHLDRDALGPAVECRLAELARDSPDGPPADPAQQDRIETLLMDVLARLTRIEARLDRMGPG